MTVSSLKLSAFRHLHILRVVCIVQYLQIEKIPTLFAVYLVMTYMYNFHLRVIFGTIKGKSILSILGDMSD